MTLRLLAPADPVADGRLAAVRASFRSALANVLATWEWEDGARDETEIGAAALVHARRTHRYAGSGVYRVGVRLGDAGDAVATRYVAVRVDGQIAGSGWVRDPSAPGPVPFGFLVTPAHDGGDDAIELRCLLGSEELRATGVSWLFVAQAGSLHFGGSATIGERDGSHPFRVDVHGMHTARGRQQLSMSVYPPGTVPGRDSPLHRIAGPIRPGRVDPGSFARGIDPANG